MGLGTFLADAPADVETCQVTHGERPHGQAKFVDYFVDLLRQCPFFDQKIGFTGVGVQHPIADETVANVDQDPNLINPFRQLHDCLDSLIGTSLTAHVLSGP